MKLSMKALARIGIGALTAAGMAVLGYVEGTDFGVLVGEFVGNPFIAGTLVALVAWVVGKVVGLIPKTDPE